MDPNRHSPVRPPADACAGDGAVRFEASPAGHLGPAAAAVTERTGGASPDPFRSLNLGRSTADLPERVRENERLVLEALRLKDRVARLRLEHGARILQVEEPGLQGPADAIWTGDPALHLWITVADCFPVVLAAGGVRMLGHCGWRGVAAGLAEAMIAAVARAAGVAAPQVRAWIGPGIGPCCYSFGAEGRAHFPDSMHPSDGGIRLDLRGEIRRRLERAGLAPGHISASIACTSCEPERFFSHRRDGLPSGRMAAVCWSLE